MGRLDWPVTAAVNSCSQLGLVFTLLRIIQCSICRRKRIAKSKLDQKPERAMSPKGMSPKYSLQDTPIDSKHAGSALILSRAEKMFYFAKVCSYILGSALFMVGSVMFYPDYLALWDGKGWDVAAWSFLIGCVFFVLGTNADFIDTIRFNSGSTTRRIVRAYNALMYVTAAGVFQLGAVYFLPEYYEISATLGCWAFIFGCIQFCIAALVDIVFICITHEDPHKTGVDMSNLKCWGTIACIGTFMGGVFFILGSYFYLPQYTWVEDADLATKNSIMAVNYFVIGCVFFIINGLAQVPDIISAFRVSNAASASRMAGGNTV